MKPDWKDAPEWAKWLAQDADGAWYWFEDEPKTRQAIWEGRANYLYACGRNNEWRESLERRP